MDFMSLSKDMQEEIIKIAQQYPLTIEEVKELYLMGGEHADLLCQMKTAGFPDVLIELQNNALWAEKNKKLWKELEKLT